MWSRIVEWAIRMGRIVYQWVLRHRDLIFEWINRLWPFVAIVAEIIRRIF